MKNKQLFAVMISFLVIVSLTGVLASLLGFRLAKKDGATVTEPDQLVGFLITTEDLNLLDMDAVMQDNMDAIISGKGIMLGDEDLNEYQGRLYATVVQVTHTDEETGATYEYDDYVFEGVDGIRFFITKQDGYTQNAFDQGIFHTMLNVNCIDVGNESISIEGTIYTLPGEPFDTINDSYDDNSEIGAVPYDSSIIIYYLNRVYQDADGNIYAISGFENIAALPEGASYTGTINEKYSITGDSADQSSEFSASITIKTAYPAESITILQMNSDNQVLSREKYKPGSLPEAIVTNKDTDYIIVETNSMDENGEIRTERSLISKGELTLSTIYYPEDSVWGIGQLTVLEWNDLHRVTVSPVM